MAINPDETREWAKGCKRVYFDNITVEEMLDSFCDLSKELHTTRAEYISKWSERGYQITRQKQQIEEWKKSNEQLWKDLRDAWSEGQTHIEAANYACGLKSESDIEHEKEKKEFTKWFADNSWVTGCRSKWFSKENSNIRKRWQWTFGSVSKTQDELKQRSEANENLRKELRWQKELLANSQKETDEQKRLREKAEFQLYLNNKPLPKRPNKLKELGRKIKVKLQHFVKSQKETMIAKIEVPVK